MNISTIKDKKFVSICDPTNSKFGGQKFNSKKHNFIFFHHEKDI
jgi:hypothetical protein